MLFLVMVAATVSFRVLLAAWEMSGVVASVVVLPVAPAGLGNSSSSTTSSRRAAASQQEG